MNKIDENLISKLEKLSKLRLIPEEKVQIGKDLEKIIEMFDKLVEVDTENVEPTRHMTSHQHPLRDDQVDHELSTKSALLNAPETHESFVAVPHFLKPK